MNTAMGVRHRAFASGVKVWLAALAVGLTVLILVAGILAPWVSPHPAAAGDLAQRLRPPIFQSGGTSAHLLGTDGLGRDVLSRLLLGLRTSALIAGAATLLAAVVGTAVGLLAAYRRRTMDLILMGVVDVHLALPGLLLALFVLAVVGRGPRVIVVTLVLISWVVFARAVRAETLQILHRDNIRAAVMIGCSPWRIVWRHVLPELRPLITTLFLVELARLLLAESALSYLGLGVQPPDVSLGLMVAENQSYIRAAWWGIALPGLAITYLVLAATVVGHRWSGSTAQLKGADRWRL